MGYFSKKERQERAEKIMKRKRSGRPSKTPEIISYDPDSQREFVTKFSKKSKKNKPAKKDGKPLRKGNSQEKKEASAQVRADFKTPIPEAKPPNVHVETIESKETDTITSIFIEPL